MQIVYYHMFMFNIMFLLAPIKNNVLKIWAASIKSGKCIGASQLSELGKH